MKLYIKNMVCRRCVMAVRDTLDEMEITPISVSLGEVNLEHDMTEDEISELDARLRNLGFKIIDDKRSRIIEKIKALIIDLVHNKDSRLDINLSDYLSEKLRHDYSYLSNLFSEEEGSTIEKYFIAQKIEKVKELLVYDELTLTEIAYQLNYSSVAHLSNQFKRVTGLTPSHFKKFRSKKRKPIDQI